MDDDVSKGLVQEIGQTQGIVACSSASCELRSFLCQANMRHPMIHGMIQRIPRGAILDIPASSVGCHVDGEDIHGFSRRSPKAEMCSPLDQTLGVKDYKKNEL